MRANTEKETQILKKRFPEAEHISPWADAEHGIDYGVLFPNNGKLNIFVQSAEKGASKSWKPTNQKDAQGNVLKEPELMLETWANRETRKHGWPFDESKTIDYVLFTFDESDSPNPYVVSYADLHEAFKAKYHEWTEKYGICKANGGLSEYCFVPVTTMFNAIIELAGAKAEEAKRQELYGNIVRGGNK